MEPEKVYVDASQAAVLRHSGGEEAFPTLQEAKLTWHLLPEAARGSATIRSLADGRIYSGVEIENFHYGPKPT